MQNAPIIIFAFNRLAPLKACVATLQKNSEAAESELIVYVDGPRANKKGEAEKVETVREFVKTIAGFKSVFCHFSDRNKGLAESIIRGTTEVIQQAGKVIVLEDDLVVSKSFLRYMNDMLDCFEADERVMQVSGYGHLLKNIEDYPYDIYLNERARSWSWGTWLDRWETVDWEVKDYRELSSSYRRKRDFNKRGTDLYKMLKRYMTGRNNSWWIRFNYSMYKQHRFSVQPVCSLVRNEGFGVDATNTSNFNRFKIDFCEEHQGPFVVPPRLEPNEKIISEAAKYYSYRYRLYGLFRTVLTKVRK